MLGRLQKDRLFFRVEHYHRDSDERVCDFLFGSGIMISSYGETEFWGFDPQPSVSFGPAELLSSRCSCSKN